MTILLNYFQKKGGGLHLRPSVGTLFIRPVRKLEQRERERERERESEREREKGGVGRKVGR